MDKREQMQALGQQLIDLIGDGAEEADLTLIEALVVLCSIAAHYIGGIPAPEERQKVYNDFCYNLAGHIDNCAESGQCADVTIERAN